MIAHYPTTNVSTVRLIRILMVSLQPTLMIMLAVIAILHATYMTVGSY